MCMKRFLIAVLVMASAIAASAAGASAPPRAKLSGFVCQTARDPATRGMLITATMRPLPHTLRMALRFDLLESQKRRGSTSAVMYGDLGKWIYPPNKTLGQRPGDRFIFHKPIADLTTAPAYYRFRVTFRWTGAHGRVLGSIVRESPACFQPELRPDLRVASISVQPNPNNPKRDIYSALIRNAGASAAGPFELQFIDGSLVRTKTVQLLDAHSRTVATFVGPLCNSSAPPMVTADPTDQIDDFNRANNSLTATCPGP